MNRKGNNCNSCQMNLPFYHDLKETSKQVNNINKNKHEHFILIKLSEFIFQHISIESNTKSISFSK